MNEPARIQIDLDKEASELLRQPYARIILPESDGTFRGEIMEFPGCLAVGNSALEALEQLEQVAVSWIAAALEKGQPIPQPFENNNEYSGKLVLRLPKSLHKKATWIAERESVSLNQFIVASISESVGEYHGTKNTVYVYSSTHNYFNQIYASSSMMSSTGVSATGMSFSGTPGVVNVTGSGLLAGGDDINSTSAFGVSGTTQKLLTSGGSNG